MDGQQVASMLALALIIGTFASVPTTVQSIGVSYGVQGNNLPSRSDVVQLYRSKGINGMLIYFPDKEALDALRNSGISLILAVGNDQLGELAKSPSNAASWIQTNVQAYYPAVNINYITVGNELTGTDAAPSILPAMQNVQDALQSAGLGGIKVSTAVKMDTIDNSSPPSNGVFKNTSVMKPIVKFLASTNAPLLANSGISLILDVGNDKLGELAANAASWVQNNVRPYYPAVKIKYIAVGNEVGGGSTQSILPAMRNLNDALSAAGLGSIKVSTSVRFDVIANSSPPSKGVFAQSYMTDIVKFLASTNAPLLANVYPYFAYKDDQGIDLNYAIFQPSSTTVHDPNGLTYTNLFDAMVDAVRAAVEKVSDGGNVDVVVSESGWPSADGRGATVENAQAYNQNLINHVGQGTPKKPGPMEVYVFAMFNENQKQGDPTEKKFGLFNPDKSPVYPIAFQGN